MIKLFLHLYENVLRIIENSSILYLLQGSKHLYLNKQVSQEKVFESLKS